MLREQIALLPEYLGQHILLTFCALAIGSLVSVPVVLALRGAPKLQGPVLGLVSAIQTIPGLALLALMVPLLRSIGFLPALIALVLYSMLPILRNAITGLAQVDSTIVEAGRALGMTDGQLLRRVELPLAMPVIVAGLRTAAVWVVGLATLSTPVGATSLGNYIFSGLQTQNYTAVLTGCVAAAGLALTIDWAIRRIEAGYVDKRRPVLAVFVLVLLAAVPLGRLVGLQQASQQLLIGTKTFTEQYILAEVLAEQLKQADIAVGVRESLGSAVAFDALRNGQIDIYIDYTGTIWTNYMNRDDNPGREQMYSAVVEWLEREHAIRVAARLGFENAYALALTQNRASELGIDTIEDLAAFSAQWRIGGDYEFFGRPEWEQLETAYGLSFAAQISMDSTLMYSAVAEAQVDVISAFSTDGRIDEFELKVLADPEEALPAYDAMVLIGPKAASNRVVVQALAVLESAISAGQIRAANRSVDLDGLSVGEAARQLRIAIGVD